MIVLLVSEFDDDRALARDYLVSRYGMRATTIDEIVDGRALAAAVAHDTTADVVVWDARTDDIEPLAYAGIVSLLLIVRDATKPYGMSPRLVVPYGRALNNSGTIEDFYQSINDALVNIAEWRGTASVALRRGFHRHEEAYHGTEAGNR